MKLLLLITFTSICSMAAMVEVQIELPSAVTVLETPTIHFKTDNDEIPLNFFSGSGTNTLIFRGFSSRLVKKASSIESMNMDISTGQIISMNGKMIYKDFMHSLINEQKSNISLTAIDTDNDVTRFKIVN